MCRTLECTPCKYIPAAKREMCAAYAVGEHSPQTVCVSNRTGDGFSSNPDILLVLHTEGTHVFVE